VIMAFSTIGSLSSCPAGASGTSGVDAVPGDSAAARNGSSLVRFMGSSPGPSEVVFLRFVIIRIYSLITSRARAQLSFAPYLLLRGLFLFSETGDSAKALVARVTVARIWNICQQSSANNQPATASVSYPCLVEITVLTHQRPTGNQYQQPSRRPGTASIQFYQNFFLPLSFKSITTGLQQTARRVRMNSCRWIRKRLAGTIHEGVLMCIDLFQHTNTD